MIITRAEYLKNSSKLHNAYYAQFCSPAVIKFVRFTIGEEKIKNSKDENFNDIPLREWDLLTYEAKNLVPKESIIFCGEAFSMGSMVCILKAAARIIKNEGIK